MEQYLLVLAITFSSPLNILAKDSAKNQNLIPNRQAYFFWINQSGNILNKINAWGINDGNIPAFLCDRFNSLRLDGDSFPSKFHGARKPLFINGNNIDGKSILCYSTLSRYVRGLQNGFMSGYADSSGKINIQMPNTQIMNLYRFAYSDDTELVNMRLPLNRIRFEMDSCDFSADSAGHYLTNRLYCYNLVAPQSETKNLRSLMQEDLKRYFGYETKWERKKMKCLVLTIDDTNKIKGTRLSFTDEEMANSITDFIYNSLGNPLKYFRYGLAESYLYYSPYPIIDETGYKGLAYFYCEADMSNWKSIDKALATYTMHLTLEYRDVNVLVVTKPKP